MSPRSLLRLDEWTRFPIARLHHTKTTGLWTLYWRHRNLELHRYQPLELSPASRTSSTTSTHADPIFWGQTAGDTEHDASA